MGGGGDLVRVLIVIMFALVSDNPSFVCVGASLPEYLSPETSVFPLRKLYFSQFYTFQIHSGHIETS
jgi:hypothetical protein